jgi:hypothetical protein
VQYLLLLIGVATGILAIGYLIPMARRDADLFGTISAVFVATVSISGCFLTVWLLLTRRVTNTGIADFFSLVLLGGFIWAVGFLLPMARRESNVFGVICSIVAALLALSAWLLIGTGVQS